MPLDRKTAEIVAALTLNNYADLALEILGEEKGAVVFRNTLREMHKLFGNAARDKLVGALKEDGMEANASENLAGALLDRAISAASMLLSDPYRRVGSECPKSSK